MSRNKPLTTNAAALVRAAEARVIPWTRIDDGRIIQLGQGRFQERLIATYTSMTNVIGQKIAKISRGPIESSARLDYRLPINARRVVRGKPSARPNALGTPWW